MSKGFFDADKTVLYRLRRVRGDGSLSPFARGPYVALSTAKGVATQLGHYGATHVIEVTPAYWTPTGDVTTELDIPEEDG